MREVGTVGEWTYQHHRMARFEDGKLFSFVEAQDEVGTRWRWVVMLPGREPKSRTKGVADTAFDAARAADAVANEYAPGQPDRDQVDGWADDHLKWLAEAEHAETEATQQWPSRGA
ncbi:MAG: hypothetical protein H6712_17310 [Myxococcales bacterium]|nr:hypothetical protein [Myxococcales bacterium]MCB9715631.1 hypothetical protein [Myxococcales bacterium]